MNNTRIVILGAGYGGLYTALKLESLLKDRQDCEILLIDKNDYHQLKTELHEVAAGRKTSEAVTIPLRILLENKRIDLLCAEVTQIDFAQKNVMTTRGKIDYDRLVIALGSETEFFGIPGLRTHAFMLTSLKDAQHIQSHIQKMFMLAKNERDENVRQTALTFIIGGGGFTGTELATELADYIHKIAKETNMDEEETSLIVVEAADTILPGFDVKLVNRAVHALESKSIRLMLKTPIVAFDGNTIHLKNNRKIQTNTLIWTGGVQCNALLVKSGLKCGPRGRIIVNPFLESVDYEGVYVVGDASLTLDPSGRPLAPTAQLALQQAEIAAFNIYAELRGKPRDIFIPKIVGQFVSLGGRDAAGWVWKFNVFGLLAWLFKRFSVLRYLYHIGGLRLMTSKLSQLFF